MILSKHSIGTKSQPCADEGVVSVNALFTIVDLLRSSHPCRTENLNVFEWLGFSVPALGAANRRSGYFRMLIGYFCRRRLWRMSGQNSLMMLLRAADSSPVAQFSPVLRKPRSCGG
jgi:hypothetical protein